MGQRRRKRKGRGKRAWVAWTRLVGGGGGGTQRTRSEEAERERERERACKRSLCFISKLRWTTNATSSSGPSL